MAVIFAGGMGLIMRPGWSFVIATGILIAFGGSALFYTGVTAEPEGAVLPERPFWTNSLFAVQAVAYGVVIVSDDGMIEMAALGASAIAGLILIIGLFTRLKTPSSSK